MKKIIILFIIGILASCGSGDSTLSQNTEDVKIEEATIDGNRIDEVLMKKGKAIYVQCLACHQANGEGWRRLEKVGED